MIEDRCIIEAAWPEALTEQQWLEARDRGIGGSDLSALLGENKYKSAITLYGEKTGIVEREKVDNPATRWGKRLEAPIADHFAEEENIAVVNWPVMLTLREKPWMRANIDRLIVEPSDQFPAGKVTEWRSLVPPTGIIALAEVKTTGIASHGAAHQWDDGGIPKSYELQCYQYGLISGVRDIFLVGLIPPHGLEIRKIQWDDDYADFIIKTEEQFWTRHVLARVAPEPDGSESSEAALKLLYPKAKTEKEFEGGADLDILWHDYQKAKAIFDDAEKDKKEKRNKIVALIGDASYGTVWGNKILSFKNSKDSEVFDEASFSRDNPKLYASYKKTRPGHRSLRGVKG